MHYRMGCPNRSRIRAGSDGIRHNLHWKSIHTPNRAATYSCGSVQDPRGIRVDPMGYALGNVTCPAGSEWIRWDSHQETSHMHHDPIGFVPPASEITEIANRIANSRSASDLTKPWCWPLVLEVEWVNDWPVVDLLLLLKY